MNAAVASTAGGSLNNSGGDRVRRPKSSLAGRLVPINLIALSLQGEEGCGSDRYNFQFVSTIKPEDAFRRLDWWGNPIVKT